MVKKLFSFLAVHEPKRMKKRDNKKKSLMLKRVLDYLKADSYMFAPLLSSQDFPFSTSSAGVEENESIEGKPKKLVRKLKDYMVSDCYMYAPLVLNQPWLRSAVCPAQFRPGSASFSKTTADTTRLRDKTKNVTGEAGGLGRNIKSISIMDQHVVQYPYTRNAIVKHTLLQQETVKHVIQQNGHPSSLQGDEKKEKRGGKGTKTKGRNTGNTKKPVSVFQTPRKNGVAAGR